jgi:hypothetical protein
MGSLIRAVASALRQNLILQILFPRGAELTISRASRQISEVLDR